MSRMKSEEIIKQILSQRIDLTREEIIERIEKNKKEAAHFLTDETAARLTASELGVKIDHKPAKLKLQIADLVSGLNDVTITGQVQAIYPTKTFTRRDWTEGKLASILVSDKSATLRVILWDDKTELIEAGKIQKNTKVKISHGYVREGRNGKPELHLGDRGTIKILEEPKS